MRLLQVFFPSRKLRLFALTRFVASLFVVCFVLSGFVCAQRQLQQMDSRWDPAFPQLDFTEMYLTQQTWMTDPGTPPDSSLGGATVSILDLAAPRKAVDNFKRGLSWLKAQNSKEAIRFLEKAVSLYPKFVSAHNALGFAYFDQRDTRAKAEFETVAKLDGGSANSFLNLGILELHSNDFATADSDLDRAARLSPNDARILSALAFAQIEDHKYSESRQTAHKVHMLGDRGMSTVHYIAALAAQALNDPSGMQNELHTLLREDPVGPLAPAARRALASPSSFAPSATSQVLHIHEEPGPSKVLVRTFPNSDRLKAELDSTMSSATDTEAKTCQTCDSPIASAATTQELVPDYNPTYTTWNQTFTIHQTVDETAFFIAVSQHGHMVDNLSLSDFEIRDNDNPPAKMLEFRPQSELPLHLGILIDVSDSVEHKISFEKQAAKEFVKNVLNGTDDLGFIAGFNSDVTVTQDFSSDREQLERGIDALRYGGDSTSVFDAIYFSCSKLLAYPDEDRVAKVLLVMTDGEDNSSHRSLQQTLREAEAAGVTIYTVNLSPSGMAEKTDADRILQVLGDNSGGDSIFPRSVRDFGKRLDKLAILIRSRYLIAYKPSNFAPNGEYRTVRIDAKSGKDLQVHAPKGYYARIDN